MPSQSGFLEERVSPDSASALKVQPGFRAIHQVNADGGGAEFLIAAPGMLLSTDPQCSHDGKHLAFAGRSSSEKAPESKIYVASIEQPFQEAVRNYGYGIEPAWAPDDRRLAYVLLSGNPTLAKAGLWVMDLDGSNRRHVGEGRYPRWAPRGGHLLCQVGAGATATLALIHLESGKTRNLLENTGWTVVSYGGNWSADGSQIVFVGTHEGADHIAVLNLNDPANGPRVLYIANSKEFKMSGPPAWSPNGKQIVLAAQAKKAPPGSPATTSLYSLLADEASSPAPLESRVAGSISRGPTFTPDGAKILFSSDR